MPNFRVTDGMEATSMSILSFCSTLVLGYLLFRSGVRITSVPLWC